MSDFTKEIKALENSFIVSVLKYATDEEHPLSAGEITARLKEITTERHDAKTVLRKLRNMCDLLESTEEVAEPAAKAFVLTYGGYIRSVSTTVSGDTGNPKPQYKFYFEPFLMPSDISMICGMLASNRYLSPGEKEHLLSTLQVLTPKQRIEEKEMHLHLPEEPVRHTGKKGRIKYIDLQNTVRILHEAIQRKLQVSVVYGGYTLDQKHYRDISFEAENPEKPYVLNPYALFWNNGFYYLLATNKDCLKPDFFRVDRIVSAKLHSVGGKTEFTKRAPVPECLIKYYKHPGTENEYFDSETYTAVHPLLISKEENLIDCCLECDSTALGLLVDTFGPVEILGEHIQILESNITHPEEENVNGVPVRYFTVRIPQVQYDNIKAFCLQHHHMITVISPSGLTLEMLKPTGLSLLKHTRVLQPCVEGREESVNPFVAGGGGLQSLLNSLQVG